MANVDGKIRVGIEIDNSQLKNNPISSLQVELKNLDKEVERTSTLFESLFKSFDKSVSGASISSFATTLITEMHRLSDEAGNLKTGLSNVFAENVSGGGYENTFSKLSDRIRATTAAAEIFKKTIQALGDTGVDLAGFESAFTAEFASMMPKIADSMQIYASKMEIGSGLPFDYSLDSISQTFDWGSKIDMQTAAERLLKDFENSLREQGKSISNLDDLIALNPDGLLDATFSDTISAIENMASEAGVSFSQILDTKALSDDVKAIIPKVKELAQATKGVASDKNVGSEGIAKLREEYEKLKATRDNLSSYKDSVGEVSFSASTAELDAALNRVDANIAELENKFAGVWATNKINDIINIGKEESKLDRLKKLAEQIKVDVISKDMGSYAEDSMAFHQLSAEVRLEFEYENSLDTVSDQLGVLRQAAENIRLNLDTGATDNVINDINAVRTELNKLKEKRAELNARLEDGTISRVQFLADTARVDRAINELENELVDIEVNIDAEEIEDLEEDLESISFGDLVNADLLADAIRELASALVDLGKASLDSGANFQSAYLRIKDTFGEASESIYAYAQASTELLGMSETAFMQSASAIGVFAKGYIKDTDKLASVTAGMTTAIADLSAQTGFSIDDTMTKVLSGLRGNTEAIEELGINVKVADMQTWLDTKGIEATFENLNSEMQNLYRTWYMLEKVASNGAMGYSAKMMETYSGQVRVLKANFEELKTTMGTYLMQALVPVLQIVNALLAKLVDLANVIGEVLGFSNKYTLATDISVSTPDVDASIYDDAISSISGVTDAQSDLTKETEKSAKAAKKALAPFHQLNILQRNDSGSDSKSTTPDISVPDIGSALNSIGGTTKEWVSPLEEFMSRLSKNKLSEKILKIKESISSFIDALKDLSPLLKGVATAIGVFIGAKVLGGLVKKLLALKGVAKIIGIVSSTFGVFKTALASGVGIFKAAGTAIGSLWKSFKAFMKGLSPLAKTVVTIASLAATFVTFKNAIKNLTLSSYIEETGEFSLTWDNLKTALINIIPMFAIAGTAMYAMFGPIGLVATAVVGLVAALAGYDAALQELTNRRVDEIFSQGTLSIQDYTNAILESNTGMLALVDTLSTTTETLASNAEQLPAITSEIDFLAGKIGFLGDESGELKTQMDEALGNLANLAKDQVEVLSKSIADTLTPEMENLAIQAGLTKDEINELLYGVDATTQSNIDKATEELKALHGVAEADRTPEQTARIEELTSWLSEAANGLDEYSTKWQTSIDAINATSLNFTDAKEGIQYFEDSMAQLLGDVEGAKTTILSQYDEKIRQVAKDPYLTEEEKKAQIDNLNILKAAADLGFEEEINNIKEQIGTGAGRIGLEYAQKFSKAVEEEMDALTETAWWTGVQLKAFQTDEGAIDELYNKAYENVSEAFAEKTGYTPDGIIEWVDGWSVDPTVPAQNIVDSFESKLISYGETKDFYGNVITSGSESAKQLAFDTGSSIGSNTSEGLASGIEENAYKAEEASAEMAQGVEDAARESLDTHSPSKVFEEIGSDVDNGLAGGITDNKSVPVNAMSNLVTDLVTTGSDTEKFKSIGSSIASSINDGIVEKAPSLLETVKGVFNDMADLGDKFLANFGSTISTASTKLAGVDTPDKLASVASTISSLHIPKLANGMVIKPNQRFLAELGDQTRGVNIETPLSTMLDAFRGALADGDYGSGGDITIPVYIGSELIDEIIVDANNRDTYRNNGR